jgi:membrane dipeptidase
MRKGGLDAAFLSIYIPGTITGAQAVSDAMTRIAAVHDLVESHPDDLALCTTADDVRRAARAGKVGLLLGMEGGHMIDNRLSLLRAYARLGVRYLTLTHSQNTDWADSSGDQPSHGGLTPFGEEVVRELNRLGVMVDISHVADDTFRDALAISQAPMIASHSSMRALAPHPRNLTDEMVKALAAKGGVVHINYHTPFLDPVVAGHEIAIARRQTELAGLLSVPSDSDQARNAARQELGPRPAASWEKIVDHIDHAVKLAGVDHVGLGSDFDGATMPVGMEDVARLPKITGLLLARGYRDADIRKILGENTLRVMRDVERVAARLQRNSDEAAVSRKGAGQ